MLSYVVRRLLYSIVVLFATSFLVFTFVSVSGDPLAALRVTPDYDPNTDQADRGAEPPRRADTGALRVLGEGRGHETSSARRCSATGRSCPTSGG